MSIGGLRNVDGFSGQGVDFLPLISWDFPLILPDGAMWWPFATGSLGSRSSLWFFLAVDML